MRIVLATHAFDGVGGSETYLLTVAEQLQRLGHGVTIYAVALGKMAELARARTIDIVAELDDLNDHCDVVIAQDGGVSTNSPTAGHKRRSYSFVTAGSSICNFRHSYPALLAPWSC